MSLPSVPQPGSALQEGLQGLRSVRLPVFALKEIQLPAAGSPKPCHPVTPTSLSPHSSFLGGAREEQGALVSSTTAQLRVLVLPPH